MRQNRVAFRTLGLAAAIILNYELSTQQRRGAKALWLTWLAARKTMPARQQRATSTDLPNLKRLQAIERAGLRGEGLQAESTTSTCTPLPNSL